MEELIDQLIELADGFSGLTSPDGHVYAGPVDFCIQYDGSIPSPDKWKATVKWNSSAWMNSRDCSNPSATVVDLLYELVTESMRITKEEP